MMIRNVALFFILVCLAMVSGACSSTTEEKKPKSDGSVAQSDSAGQLTCSGIDDCIMKCAAEDGTCMDGCYAQGTATAKAQFDALEACWDQAASGACQSACTDPESEGCFTCTDQACANEMTACGI